MRRNKTGSLKFYIQHQEINCLSPMVQSTTKLFYNLLCTYHLCFDVHISNLIYYPKYKWFILQNLFFTMCSPSQQMPFLNSLSLRWWSKKSNYPPCFSSLTLPFSGRSINSFLCNSFLTLCPTKINRQIDLGIKREAVSWELSLIIFSQGNIRLSD